MDTSFIPKKDFTRKENSKNYIGFATIVSIVIFIVALFAAGGVYFYKQFLMGEIENKSITLTQEKGGLDLNVIQELSRFDERIESATKLLNSHVSLIPLFEFLEENTLKGVRYERFTFSVEKGGLALDLKGEASSYATVALQSEIFGSNKNIIDPIFSDLGVSPSGNITFSFSSKLDPRLISYRDNLTTE
ncbi:MAG: hypothetical protein V1851_01170 [Patescibacteria group bacterium]